MVPARAGTIWLCTGCKCVAVPPGISASGKGRGLGGSLPFDLLQLPTVFLWNNSQKDRSCSLKSIPAFLFFLKDTTLTLPWHGHGYDSPPALASPGTPRTPLPSNGEAGYRKEGRRGKKKSWQFHSNKRSLKSISTATQRLLANRILISMWLFFF